MNTLSVAAFLSLVLASCGGETGSGGGGGCGPVEDACGGDVVGTWRVVTACVGGPSQQTISTCSEPLTSEIQNATYAGTVTFNSDSSYETNVTVSGNSIVTYPAACLPGGLSCEQLNQSLRQAPTTSDGVKGTGCAVIGGGACRCSFSVQSPPHQTLGSYSTSGNTVTISINGRSTTTEYCVQGNKLTLKQPETAPTGSGTIQTDGTGHVVFAKQ